MTAFQAIIQHVEKLKKSGYAHDDVVFHQLDVADPASISRLADFITNQFGKLDILVNNAGVGGVVLSGDVDVATLSGLLKAGPSIKWNEISTQSYELADECVRINYNGAKRMCEALIPLLQLSNSPRIVNVSSSMGKLQLVTNEWAKRVIGDVESLTEEKVDDVLREYLKDYKEGLLETKVWPGFLSAYILSKAAISACTRILARKYPSFCINCVCPGFVKTDINHKTDILSVEEGAEICVRLALLPNGGPSGLFFSRKEETSF
ncbi:(+)-neomenthol dehydrogenase-like [Pistacia vera]|uniref:(+)-neomenthol dehydrogenase-like n=1 Tax=Pistacia vera TaxID=55513 RepID=UPI001263B33D|nr:(+)-neomenthol dehydrogenase-like [Pistacia vera]